jgi:hypothetical protein
VDKVRRQSRSLKHLGLAKARHKASIKLPLTFFLPTVRLGPTSTKDHAYPTLTFRSTSAGKEALVHDKPGQARPSPGSLQYLGWHAADHVQRGERHDPAIE